MVDFEIFDKTFTLSKITAYSLSLEIDYKHLAYTIIDHIRKRFVAVVNHEFKDIIDEQTYLDVIERYIKKDQYLQKHYKEVDFIYPSKKFLLVPEQYFDRQYIKLYFEKTNKLLPGEEIQFNYIAEINTYLLFAISSNITNFFVFNFPEINFYHQGIPLIKAYIRFSKQNDKTLIAINFRRGLLLDVLVTREGNLLFYNIFECTGKERALYIILRVLKDYGFDSQIELLGDISEGDDLHKLLVKFIPNVKFAQLQKDYIVDFDQDFEIHRFANLFYISD